MAKKKDGGQMDDLISQVEAARLRGVTKSAINDLIRRGRLVPVEVAGHRLLRRGDVESLDTVKGWPKGKPRK